jgi:hypothetical protein
MSVTFSKKRYTCATCGHKGNELLAIKRNSDLETGYPIGGKPEQLKDNGIYFEQLVRDEYGIVILREAKERPCEKCGNFTLEADKIDNENPVLNFYPQTEAHKWLDGFAKAGM